MALRRNLVANYVGQALKALLGILLVPVYVKYLGVEAYGLVGLFGVIQAWLVLLDLGVRPALSRELARFSGGAHSAEWVRDLLRSIEIIGVAGASFVAVGGMVAAPWLARHWVEAKSIEMGTLTLALAVIALVAALRFVENIYTSALTGLQRQVLENGVSASAAIVRGLGAVAVLAWVSPTIVAFFVWQGIVSVVSLTVLAALAYRELPSTARPARFSRAALKEISGYALGMLVISLQSLLLTNLDKLVLSKLLPLSEFGKYTLASVAANSLALLAQPAATALSPRLTELAARRDEVQLARVYHFGAQAIAVLAGSAAVVLVLYAERVIRLWTMNPTLSSEISGIAALLVIGTLFNSLTLIPYHLQLAHGRTGLTTKFNLVLISVITPALFIVTPRYGPFGAAALWAVLNASYVLFAVPLFHQRVLKGELARWYVSDTLVPLGSAIAVALTLKVLIQPFENRLLEFIAIACISIATLAAATLSASEARSRILSRWSSVFAKQPN